MKRVQVLKLLKHKKREKVGGWGNTFFKKKFGTPLVGERLALLSFTDLENSSGDFQRLSLTPPMFGPIKDITPLTLWLSSKHRHDYNKTAKTIISKVKRYKLNILIPDRFVDFNYSFTRPFVTSPVQKFISLNFNSSKFSSSIFLDFPRRFNYYW